MRRGVKGLKTGTRPLLWSAAALLLLLSVAVPVVNVVTIMLLIVPFAVLYVILPVGSFAVHLVAVWIAAFVMMGPAAILIGLFFVVPAIVMGQLYRRKAAASSVITAVTLTLLGLFLLELTVLSFIFDIQLIGEMSDLIRNNLETFAREGILSEGVWTPAMAVALIDSMVASLPVALITISFVYAAFSHGVARAALRKSGIDLPAFRRAKDWMLPRTFVLYYLIVIVLDLLMPEKDGTFLSIVVLNLLPLLRFAFTVQTIGFLFFLAAEKKWHRSLPILLSVPVLLFPPLSLIGVLDVAFPIRKSFVKP